MVFAAYRKDDYADPSTFLVQLVAVLERYDDPTVKEATNPITGIQRHSKFPPTIAEVAAFCDESVRRSTYASQYDARSNQQLQEREQFERQGKQEPPEHRKAVAERIKAELRAKGFKFEGDVKGPTPEQAREHLKNAYHVTDEQLDQIPNQPDSNDYWQGMRWPTPDQSRGQA